MNNPLEKSSKIARSKATFSIKVKLSQLSFSKEVFTNLNSLGFSLSPCSTRFLISGVEVSLFLGKHWPKSAKTAFTQPRNSQAAEKFDNKSAKMLLCSH